MKPVITVLVVDDNTDVRKVLRRMLEKPHIGVCEAGTFEQARAAAQTARFDLLVCDVNLPDGDGLDLVEWARKEQPSLKAVVVTGEPTKEGMRRAQKAQAAFLVKPVAAEHLAAAVQAVFEEGQGGPPGGLQ